MNLLHLPVPLDRWEPYRADILRFADTLRQFDPGEGYQLLAACAWHDPTEDLKQILRDLPVRYIRYDGPGLDTGSAQFVADQQRGNHFLICFTSSHYFYREGWLLRLCEARRKFGPGLYGLCANRETYPLHLCLRCYGIDSDDFKLYPHHVNNRLRCHQWEVYHALPWMRSLGHVTKLVAWDGVYDEPDWFSRPNRFRHGDQTNVLVWDRHTDAYRDGTPQLRAQLEAYQRA